MRLYKMELYKICHRKIFILGVACVIGILLFFFHMKVSEEETFVDGVTYKGYEAVQINREITEEFKGVFTDKKAEEIIEKYGFPNEVKENHLRFADSNFLNNFVMEYLSDGYFRGREDYEIATKLYEIADTTLGEAKVITGREIILEYNDGWGTFLDVLDIGLILGSILILFGISIVFAIEGQAKMIQVLFTTKEGRKGDIYAKIAAAYTVSAAVWLGVVVLDFLLCGVVYGFGGWKGFAGMADMIGYIFPKQPVTILRLSVYIVIVLFRSMLGILMLCSTTIFISSCSENTFHAVIYSVICWGMPVLLWILLWSHYSFIFRLIRLCLHTSPFYLCMSNSFIDCCQIWTKLAGVSIAVSVLCTFLTYRNYRKQQRGGLG